MFILEKSNVNMYKERSFVNIWKTSICHLDMVKLETSLRER